MTTPDQDSRQQIVDRLRDRLRRLERDGTTGNDENPFVGSGCRALDRLLPGGGFRRGKLVEWLCAGPGSGAGTLSLLTAARIAGPRGTIAVLDESLGDESVSDESVGDESVSDGSVGEERAWGGDQEEAACFYPPAAAAWGIDLDNLLVIRPRGEPDTSWAWNQVLRCAAVSAVWGRVERLDERSFRRWQLAAETGGTIGFLLRSADVRGQPSWAETQLLVEPLATTGPRLLRVRVIRCRGAAAGGVAEFELDEVSRQVKPRQQVPSDETHPLPVVSQLARPATSRRSTSA